MTIAPAQAASPRPAGITPGEQVPPIAWPTVALFAGALATGTASTLAYLNDSIPWWVVIPINALVSFVMFTVLHDCAHTAAGRRVWVNKVLGRLAAPFVVVYVAFPGFRFIHMQHHLNTNEDHDKDPDGWISHGPAWQLPFRWLVVDVHYARFYAPRAKDRPRAEVYEMAAMSIAALALIVVSIIGGWFVEFLVAFLIPQRIGLVILAWWFDWLPHHGLEETQRDNKYRATRNRVGLEKLLTPALLSQNYHLVHHLHPVVPFYRYLAVWRKNEEAYLERDPALSKVVGGELSVEEYRVRRGLEPTA